MKKLFTTSLFTLSFLLFGNLCHAQFIDLYDFSSNPDGANPNGGLIKAGNIFYGMTSNGGANGDGAVFSIHTDGTHETVLHSFTGNDGQFPLGTLTLSGNKLFGMTYEGGVNSDGVVFTVDTNGNNYKKLWDFNAGSNGAYPRGAVTLIGSVLYGLTSIGGVNGDGCIFSVDSSGGGFRNLHSFAAADGSNPFGDLTLLGHQFFGTTYGSGANGQGTLFSIDTNGSNYIVRCSYGGLNGGNPVCSLVFSTGKFYGTSYDDGINGDGAIFSVDSSGLNYKDIFDFGYTDGDGPYYGPLVLLSNGELWGTAESGGAYGAGNIFSIDTNGAGFDDRFDFNYSNGYQIYGGLINLGNTFYGMTGNGAANGYGSIYSIDTNCLMTVSTNNSTGEKCYGDTNDGVAIATIGNGFAPYTYSWSNGATTDTVSGLSVGTYSVTVTDKIGGCSATASVNINRPSPVGGSFIYTNGGCFGDNICTTVFGTGGTPGYNFIWVDANSDTISTTSTDCGLAIGSIYSVTIVDLNGCSKDTSITIPADTVTLVTSVTQQIMCNGSYTGSASVSINNSNISPSRYQYLWAPSGQNTNVADGLSAGTYTVYVRDPCGDIDSAFVTITQPALLTATVDTITNVHCGEMGSAVAIVSGGVSPYTYLWNDPAAQTTAIATGLSAGVYTVTIEDLNSCDDFASVTITQPANGLAITMNTTNTPTCGENNGSATANPATGGTNPYTYSWSPSGGTNLTATGLSAGIYTITVTDAHGCTSEATATIYQPDAQVGFNYEGIPQRWIVPANVTQVAIVAFGGSGGSASGGEGALVVGLCTVTPGHTLSIIAGGEGNYSPSNPYGTGGGGGTFVYDSNTTTLLVVAGGGGGCSQGYDESPYMGGDGGLDVYSYATTVGAGDGSAPGGTAGNGGSVGIETYYTAVGAAGAGWLSNGASAVATYPSYGGADRVNLFQGGAQQDGNGNGGGYGGGGGGNYDCGGGGGGYNGGGGGLDNSTDIGGGGGGGASYLNGLLYFTTTSAGPGFVYIDYPSSPLAITTTSQNVTCNGENNGTATANVSGGISPYNYQWSDASSQITNPAVGLSQGTYTVTVTASGGCTIMDTVVINQPNVLAVTANTVTNISCNTMGTAIAAVSGGTLPYTYLWNDPNNQTTATASGLSAGTYTVTVNDINDCGTITATITITQPANQLTLAITADYDAGCAGTSGSSTATASSGTAPYTYSWAPNGGTNATATALSAGNYTVTVTDASGCTYSTEVYINQPYSDFGFSYEPAVQNWTVPAGVTQVGIYTVGAGGGGNGGGGTYLIGLCNVTPGDNLSIVVGGQGNYSSYGFGAGGGGGTFVYDSNTGSLLMVAGGGGGSSEGYNYQGGNAGVDIINNTTTSGYGDGSGPGGINGNGGAAGIDPTDPYTDPASGGAGWISNGANYLGVYADYGAGYDRANSFQGGAAQPDDINYGGYGGGAGGFDDGGGGGGGYNGGGGGNDDPNYNGGGGGGGASYINTTYVSIQNPPLAGNYGSDGFVEVFYPTPALTITMAQTNVYCSGGNNGNAIANVIGGYTPYTYTWSNSQTTATATGLSAGAYFVTVTGSTGCTMTDTVVITQPDIFKDSVIINSNVLCNGSNEGSLSAITSGGTAPYTYSWTSGSTTDAATGLSIGSYTVTIHDNCGNLSTASAVITQPAGIVVSRDSVDANGGSNGSAGVTVSGGIAPYTYSWAPGGKTTASISGLSAGSYCCTIHDANGCTNVTCIIVKSSTGIDNIDMSSGISIYPDPTIGNFTITGVTTGQVINMYDYTGQELSSLTVDKNTTMNFDISTKANGMYLVRILNSDGTLATEKKIVKVQ